MNPKLTEEQIKALHASGDELEIVDPTTNRVYVIVDQENLKNARAALHRQQKDDIAAIQRGVDDMEASRTVTMEDAHKEIRQQLRSQYGE